MRGRGFGPPVAIIGLLPLVLIMMTMTMAMILIIIFRDGTSQVRKSDAL